MSSTLDIVKVKKIAAASPALTFLSHTPLAIATKIELEKQYFQTATVMVSVGCGCPRTGCRAVGPYFTIFGQVQRQGRYEIDKDEKLTIVQAILRAGGPVGISNPKVAKVVRKTAEGKKTIEVNLKEILDNGDATKDILILDGDVIILPVNDRHFDF